MYMLITLKIGKNEVFISESLLLDYAWHSCKVDRPISVNSKNFAQV